MYCDRCLKTLKDTDTFITFYGKTFINTPKGLDTTYYLKIKQPLSPATKQNQYYMFSASETIRRDMCAECLIELMLFCKKED